MRAVVAQQSGGPDVLEWTTAPDPVPAADECVVRVQACGACMHDVLVRRGDRTKGVEFPVILGHEVVGEIVAVGEQVREFATGDRVVSVQRQRVCGKCRECRSGRESRCPNMIFLGDMGLNGGYSELATISEGSLVKVPPTLTSLSVAVAACSIGTQLNALRDVAELAVGETLLVTGAGGGVGLHAVQLGKAIGAYVIAQTTSADKVEAIDGAGADEVVVTGRGADFSDEVVKRSGGCGCDVVLENVGSVSFPSSVRTLALHGRIVIVGEVLHKPAPVQANLSVWRARDITIKSAASTNRRQLEDTLGLVARGLVRPTVSQTLPMSKAAEAHEKLEKGGVTGRLLLVPDGTNYSADRY